MSYMDNLHAAYDDLERESNNPKETYLSKKQKTILNSFRMYRSPIHEESYYKGIDILLLPYFKKHFKGFFRYRPRGGTYHIQNNCTMRDAKTFAIYGIQRWAREDTMEPWEFIALMYVGSVVAFYLLWKAYNKRITEWKKEDDDN